MVINNNEMSCRSGWGVNQMDIPTIIKSIWASMTRCKDSLLENGWLNIYPNHLNGKVTTFSLTGNKLVFNAFISMYILTLLTCLGGGFLAANISLKFTYKKCIWSWSPHFSTFQGAYGNWKEISSGYNTHPPPFWEVVIFQNFIYFPLSALLPTFKSDAMSISYMYTGIWKKSKPQNNEMHTDTTSDNIVMWHFLFIGTLHQSHCFKILKLMVFMLVVPSIPIAKDSLMSWRTQLLVVVVIPSNCNMTIWLQQHGKMPNQ